MEVDESYSIVRWYDREAIHCFSPTPRMVSDGPIEVMEFKQSIWIFERCDPYRIDPEILHPILRKMYPNHCNRYATYLLLGHENPVRKAYNIEETFTVPNMDEPTEEINLDKVTKKLRKAKPEMTKNLLSRFYQS